jgi:hypothetical protein
MTDLIINLCTRNRHDLFPDTVQRTLAMIKNPRTRLIVAIDADDMDSVKAANDLPSHPQLEVSISQREDSLGGKYNRILQPKGSDILYLAMVDYSPLLIPGFDDKFLHAASVFPDGIGVVYGPLANMSFPCLQAITQGLVDIQGYWYPECYPYWFVDHELQDIAKMIGRVAYAPCSADFVTRRQPNTIELRDVYFWSTYFDMRYLRRRELALKIIWSKTFDAPQWLRTMLSEAIPLTEQLSVMINSNCRATAPQVQEQRGAQPVDARYERIFRRAVAETEVLSRELDEFARATAGDRAPFASIFGASGLPGFAFSDADVVRRQCVADMERATRRAAYAS